MRLEIVDPQRNKRSDKFPPLALLRAHTIDPQEVEGIKREEGIPVIIVFPARGDEELLTLEREIQILQPLLGKIIDEIWIAFGGKEHDDIPLMAKNYGVQVYYAHKNEMGDAQGKNSGKGLAMRGLIYHLCMERKLCHPEAIIEFIDADIKEGYFNPRWVIDPVGAILWFKEVEVAKIVYHRPFGGRLNAFIIPFISIFDHPSINPLRKLLYSLSGEIAGTLRFWLSVPFKQNFGIEMKILTSLAFNKINLRHGSQDLTHVLQVYVGEMDHKHNPLHSWGKVKGLDAMAKEVFQTFLEDLAAEGLINLEKGLQFSDRLFVPAIDLNNEGGRDLGIVHNLELPAHELTFAPLKDLPEIRQICSWLK